MIKYFKGVMWALAGKPIEHAKPRPDWTNNELADQVDAIKGQHANSFASLNERQLGERQAFILAGLGADAETMSGKDIARLTIDYRKYLVFKETAARFNDRCYEPDGKN